MAFCDGDFPGSERSVVVFLKDMRICSVCLQKQPLTKVQMGRGESHRGGCWNFRLCHISLRCFCVYVSGAGMGKKEVAFI